MNNCFSNKILFFKFNTFIFYQTKWLVLTTLNVLLNKQNSNLSFIKIHITSLLLKDYTASIILKHTFNIPFRKRIHFKSANVSTNNQYYFGKWLTSSSYFKSSHVAFRDIWMQEFVYPTNVFDISLWRGTPGTLPRGNTWSFLLTSAVRCSVASLIFGKMIFRIAFPKFVFWVGPAGISFVLDRSHRFWVASFLGRMHGNRKSGRFIPSLALWNSIKCHVFFFISELLFRHFLIESMIRK